MSCSKLHLTDYYLQHVFFFFFNDTATTEIYTLSLHDALPIYAVNCRDGRATCRLTVGSDSLTVSPSKMDKRSEEHTSELQSRLHLVCRLLLEKKKNREAPKTACPKSIRCRARRYRPRQ